MITENGTNVTEMTPKMALKEQTKMTLKKRHKTQITKRLKNQMALKEGIRMILKVTPKIPKMSPKGMLKVISIIK